MAHIGDGHGMVAHPGAHAPEEPVVLPHPQKIVRHHPVDQAEIPGIQGDGAGAHAVEQPVIAPGGKPLEDGLPFPADPLPIGNIRSLLPGGHQLADHRWGIL